MIDIFVLSNDKEYEVRKITNDLELSNDKENLGAELSFSISNLIGFEEGDIILLKENNLEIFRGIIVDYNPDLKSKSSYVSLDFAFYLNENQVFYKFNNESASNCITKILKDFNITIGDIPNITHKIKKIYNGEKASEVIKDILEQVTDATGTEYYFEMKYGKFYIYDLNKFEVEYEVDDSILLSDLNFKRSIKSLKNSVVVTLSEEEDGRILHTSKDNNSISKFGQLQLIEKINKEEEGKASSIASKLLKEKNKTDITVSFSIVGDFSIHPARLIRLNLKSIKGVFRIKNVKHSIANKFHKTSLELEVI